MVTNTINKPIRVNLNPENKETLSHHKFGTERGRQMRLAYTEALEKFEAAKKASQQQLSIPQIRTVTQQKEENVVTRAMKQLTLRNIF